MKQYLNYLFVTILIGALYPLVGNAQSMSVSVPSHVSVGENFRLSYTINTQEVENFRAGNIPEAIEVIAGPYTSSQSSFQMVNGSYQQLVFRHIHLHFVCFKEWYLHHSGCSCTRQRKDYFIEGSESDRVRYGTAEQRSTSDAR